MDHSGQVDWGVCPTHLFCWSLRQKHPRTAKLLLGCQETWLLPPSHKYSHCPGDLFPQMSSKQRELLWKSPLGSATRI